MVLSINHFYDLVYLFEYHFINNYILFNYLIKQQTYTYLFEF